MNKSVIVTVLVFVFISVKAQDNISTIEQIIADIFEQYSEETDEEIDFETFYDELKTLAENPIDLNNATRENLEKLVFLTDMQIENILSYTFSFGTINTIYELQFIDGLDMTDIRRILPFVYVGAKNTEYPKIYWRDVKKYGRNEILYRLDRGIELRKGFKENISESEITNPKYVGSAFYNSLKYHFNLKERIMLGLAMEKDAGEAFLNQTKKGYDFYSIYAQINNFGRFKTIVAGDYRANFGMGLVIRQGLSMGKSSYVLNVIPRNSGLKKYSSTDEYNFFRGTACTLNFGKLNATAFYSNRMIDADTINNSFASIYKTGLHRTESELLKKHTVNKQVFGTNLTYTHSKIQIGFTMVHTLLNINLKHEIYPYNLYYFSGNKQTNFGLTYRLRLHKLNVFGETAFNQNFALATINGVMYSPVSQVSLVALYRNYAPEYNSLYANSFSESSTISNEKGFYIGAEILPFKKWKISVYSDSYQFSWPKYGVDGPSIGQDYLLQLDYTTRRDLNMYWRIRYEQKEKNYFNENQALNEIVSTTKASIRYQLVYTYGNFNFKNLMEVNLVQNYSSTLTYGFTALQDISYRFRKIPLKIDLRYQFFDAEAYENRFYTYEKDLLYAFSIPMIYRTGSRMYLNIKFDLNRNMSFWLKYAQTIYSDDLNIIGSGNDEIIGNRKNDLRFMFRYEF